MTEAPPAKPSVWSDALLALSLFAIDPAGTGIALRAPAGVVRDRFLARLPGLLAAGTGVRKMPATIGDEALLGGLDLSAALTAGRRIAEPGFLAASDGGVVIAAMAERLPEATAAILAGVLDDGVCRGARDAPDGAMPCRIGLIALDEGIGDEGLTPVLLDRLAFHIDLTGLSHHEILASGDDMGARAAGSPHPPNPSGWAPPSPASAGEGSLSEPCWAPGMRPPSPASAGEGFCRRVEITDGMLEALCTTAASLGAGFVRAPLLALNATRAVAARAGRSTATMEDAAIAARLVLAPRATRLPAEPPNDETPPPSDPPPEPQEAESQTMPPDGADILLQAAKAAIPQGLLERLIATAGKGPQRSGAGRAGAKRKGGQRGRPVGVRAATPGPGLRLALIETLRAAAPWQRIRAMDATGTRTRIRVRREDFRVTRVEQRSRTTTIFLVDASGSSALNRLAEAKGAVELLLAECYKRRDQVAVLAFRGRDAKILLPPTRSLTRAKRSLAGLPGGGGTPLAAGIEAGFLLAGSVRRAGDTPTLVFLTDGRANVSLSGEGGRAKAEQDARHASRRLRAAGLKTLFVDISPRPSDQARSLATDMGALYIALPTASAAAVSAAVRAATQRS